MAESLRVAVRVRPADSSESCLLVGPDNSLEVAPGTRRGLRCAFDAVLGPETTQTGVYSLARSCTTAALEGFNATVFAYGQTGEWSVRSRSPLTRAGSGKTFTMLGPPSTSLDIVGEDFVDPQAGIIPR